MVRKKAFFGGGCFWCLEAVFLKLVGVEEVLSGYMGGELQNPTYEQVCSGTTGHVEIICIDYTPDSISYETLLKVFFSTHDPTTLNRQGNDVGSQYKSVVFFNNSDEENMAMQEIAYLENQGIFRNPIVTELSQAKPFYPAEHYHKNYYANNPYQPYCRAIIEPKIRSFTDEWKSFLKS